MSTDTVTVLRDIQAQKRAEAEAWRDAMSERGIFCVNLISSPGAGKTSILQAMARHWNGDVRMAVLVGDIATDRDAQRLASFMPVRQLTTGGACHLELSLVKQGWDDLNVTDLQFLIVENIGNLVCPASHDLGEHLRVVVLSVTEGDDKPGKYPKAFRTSHVCVINKMDLLPYVPFSLDAATDDAHRIRGDMPVMTMSAITGEGIPAWCDFLTAERQKWFGMSVR